MAGLGAWKYASGLKESGDTMRISAFADVGKMEPFKAEEARRVAGGWAYHQAVRSQ